MNVAATVSRFTPQALSILRIVAALLFMAHGTQKILWFPESSMHPALGTLPWVAGMFELVGGCLLIVGLFSRIVAFVLSGEMAFAYFMAHAPKSPFPAINGGDAAILFCFVFLYIFFAGPGIWSVDAVARPEDA